MKAKATPTNMNCDEKDDFGADNIRFICFTA